MADANPPRFRCRLALRLAVAGVVAGLISSAALLARHPVMLLVPATLLPVALAASASRTSRGSSIRFDMQGVHTVSASLVAMVVAGVLASILVGSLPGTHVLSAVVIGGVAGAVGAMIFCIPWKENLQIASWRAVLVLPGLAGLVSGGIGAPLAARFADSSDDPKWLGLLVVSVLWQGAVGGALGLAADRAEREGSVHSEVPDA